MRINKNNKNCDLSIGQLVKSKSGRDKEECFIVYDIIDKNYVLLVDGKLRKLSKPKKKKIKHLQKYDIIIDNFNDMKEQENFNDALIRRLIISKKIQEET